MHEAGLAASVAMTLRGNGLDAGGPPIRLIVHGGHDPSGAFDEALRLHLRARLPELDQSRVSIVHAPRRASCVDCGSTFSTTAGTPCPACGGAALMPPMAETIELEWSEIP